MQFMCPRFILPSALAGMMVIVDVFGECTFGSKSLLAEFGEPQQHTQFLCGLFRCALSQAGEKGAKLFQVGAELPKFTL